MPGFIESRRFKKVLVAHGRAQLIALSADLPIGFFQAEKRHIIEPHKEFPFLYGLQKQKRAGKARRVSLQATTERPRKYEPHRRPSNKRDW